ncbi:UvrD-helicase domain-containing protein [Burkholderia multivorans]|uniref:UvrD-helicase domain-containing protein n=1 Tax=Burkholderia multivorans TaxID=87883 RepID=UPI001589A78E|nr:UvrD-helicase domain-containing protein [Burkholderia multivorans]MDR8877268.1 ATP-dependent DNA helicase Rep [Burkholderia multivorans]MDR8882472.1 ATP-dependent DNA helicase Rep [Burkholderia multivorans]MDR8889467.1 ATP-dependent DNA helicase Rep [Burkholderia multivorans]MDR8908221.1 ATP-dependent DNA helicase Rep [Burkholderia multivorans]MDR8913929.1 ATP-dependent DNA helicase Rep [Burkholderia multivorans]
MKPTAEQEAIIASRAPRIKVRAGAGTGKTSTLVKFAEANPRERILYLAFNKSIQTEAAGKFPGNVKAVTTHALAYRDVGRDYGNVANKLQGDMKPFHVQRHLAASLANIPIAAHQLYGGRVIETIKAFLVSSDPAMTSKHVVVGQAPVERAHFDPNRVLADSHRIWGMMQDLKSDVPMLHDGYLKLYQLKQRSLPYGVILADEWQDTNPVTQAIVDIQNARKVYVGDSHQAIYAFRGAMNTMDTLKADATFSLTGSFRFGEEVARIANDILEIKRDDFTLHGLGQASRIGELPQGMPSAYISRGNVALFDRAVQALSSQQPFAFVGDIRGYRFDQIMDVHNLTYGGKVKDAFIGSFASIDELAEYAELIDDREVKSRCKVVTKYGTDIPRLIEQIERNALPPVVGNEASRVGDNRVILTTGHKSKGLEFDHVKLADDFMSLIDDEGKLLDITKASTQDIEEVNIQYVSVTRAKATLQLCDGLADYLECVEGLKEDQRNRMYAM